jgi:precorrin-2 dehydrogenase/sirohydrochlorin ferrochelatase
MDAFPAFFPLAGRTVVIAGGGDAAEAKARLFEGSPARLVRLEGAAALEAADYAGALLAFVAGGDPDFLKGARAAAKAAGALVNVTDHPELCDFTTPAVIDRGAVVAAVGTGGAAPLMASLLRTDIEARVPEGAGRVAALIGGMQAEIRAALPDLVARRAFLRSALDGPAAEAAMAGRMDEARRRLREALEARAAGRAAGRACLIAPVAAADLLSLRAARRLAEADVVAAGAAADPGVLALARRDARRIRADPAVIAAAVAEGLTVLVVGAPELAGPLAAAGVAVETLASAAP